MIRPSSLSCLHAQNTRDEGGHMTSSSPAREERERTYILVFSFFFFLAQVFQTVSVWRSKLISFFNK